jgi:hypothetical protein
VFAYRVANSGSIIVAAVAGGLAGIAGLFEFWGHRGLGFFSRKHREQAATVRSELVDDPADS